MYRSFKAPKTKPCDHILYKEWYAPRWMNSGARGTGERQRLGAPTITLEQDQQACPDMVKFGIERNPVLDQVVAVLTKQDIDSSKSITILRHI
jgi:hypothetical protein